MLRKGKAMTKTSKREFLAYNNQMEPVSESRHLESQKNVFRGLRHLCCSSKRKVFSFLPLCFFYNSDFSMMSRGNDRNLGLTFLCAYGLTWVLDSQKQKYKIAKCGALAGTEAQKEFG